MDPNKTETLSGLMDTVNNEVQKQIGSATDDMARWLKIEIMLREKIQQLQSGRTITQVVASE